MGKAVVERGGMMYSGPSKIAQAIVAVLVSPACREEVLGDLHERFTSPRQYALDALRTALLVIISRIRRTLDPQILLIQAFAWYMSFLSPAWLTDRALLREQWGFLRLAIPAAIAILGLILDDAYASPGQRSALNLARATCWLKNGKTARTVLPADYRDVLIAMQDKRVNIEIRDASSDPFRLLINATPFFVLLAFWIFLMMRKLPNGDRSLF